MSFGRNPHVAKAETAEQKARSARDHLAREQAWREAARQWERAAHRETDDKRRTLYTEKAEAARTQADEPSADDAKGNNGNGNASGNGNGNALSHGAAHVPGTARKPTMLN